MARPPDPINVYHFTHLHNLPGIINQGLRSDSVCRREQLTQVEIGSNSIRERRLELEVGAVGPGGSVGDYVPWYFGPRSPMMFALNRRNYEYQGGFDDVVYLVSSVPTMVRLGHKWIASDRNAALAMAEFTDNDQNLDGHVSWDVISARYWTDYEDGADLRAAEFLVHDSAQWAAVETIATRTQDAKDMVESLIAGTEHTPPVAVRPQWYF